MLIFGRGLLFSGLSDIAEMREKADALGAARLPDAGSRSASYVISPSRFGFAFICPARHNATAAQCALRTLAFLLNYGALAVITKMPPCTVSSCQCSLMRTILKVTPTYCRWCYHVLPIFPHINTAMANTDIHSYFFWRYWYCRTASLYFY